MEKYSILDKKVIIGQNKKGKTPLFYATPDMIENVYASNLFISVDVNGVGKEPNAWGHDLFTFQVTDDGRLLPMGALGTRYTNMSLYCSPTSSDEQNGIACTEKALRDSKYFKNLPRGKKTID